MNFGLRVALSALLLLNTTSGFTQIDIFIKIAGLPGNSQDKTMAGYYEVTETGQANIACTSGGCATVPGNLTFNMRISEANPLLQTRLFKKTVIQTVDVVYRKAGSSNGMPVVFYQIHLDNVIVKSIAEAVSDEPGSQFSLSSEKIAWKYIPQKPDGSPGTAVTACYDATSNRDSGCGTFPSF